MNAYLRNIISEYLKQNNQNLSTEKTEVVKNKISVDSDDVGISSQGIKYHKSALSKYLIENGISMDQYNIDMYAKAFQLDFDDSDEATVSHTMSTQVEELDHMNDSDFNNYISFLLLKSITELNNSLSEASEIIINSQKKQYAVECLYDNFRGGLNINRLLNLLNEYAEKGWRLKTIFTNELGKNAVSINGFGTNSTQDQIIIVFEK